MAVVSRCLVCLAGLLVSFSGNWYGCDVNVDDDGVVVFVVVVGIVAVAVAVVDFDMDD